MCKRKVIFRPALVVVVLPVRQIWCPIFFNFFFILLQTPTAPTVPVRTLIPPPVRELRTLADLHRGHWGCKEADRVGVVASNNMSLRQCLKHVGPLRLCPTSASASTTTQSNTSQFIQIRRASSSQRKDTPAQPLPASEQPIGSSSSDLSPRYILFLPEVSQVQYVVCTCTCCTRNCTTVTFDRYKVLYLTQLWLLLNKSRLILTT